MKIVTYEEAKINKLKRFFISRKCRNGHIDEQLTSSRECISCKREREARKYDADPTAHRQQYINNREKRLAQQKAADATRRDDKIRYRRRWRSLNHTYAQRYRKENAGLYAFHTAARKKKIIRATPPWAEVDLIRDLYLESQHVSVNTGIAHEIDHIIPLINEDVCGLHVLANLQILTQDENRKKKNKFSLE